jgi:hypothetical protein
LRKLLTLLSAVALAGLVEGGCDAGSPPTTPELFGPDTVGVGDTLTIRLWSKDADDDYISFTIRWGDASGEEETPFTAMLDTLSRTHVYDLPGSYGIVAKAKDLNRLESGWSDTLRLVVQ